jgi:hypothetical protein
MMESSSQNPMMPATRKPNRPITGILCQRGGISARTMTELPTIRAARTMAKAMRLETRSRVTA